MEREGVMVVVLLVVVAVVFGRGGSRKKSILEKRGRGEKEGAERGLWMGFEDKKNPRKTNQRCKSNAD